MAAERGHAVVLAEAGPQLGRQFRLAGEQPRRAQITDLIDWYTRQLGQLGVEVRYNSYLDADDISGEEADVVVATGSIPAETGFQKALPHVVEMPGAGAAVSVEDVMGRSARLGKRVAILDEGGGWKGIGTTWKLAEDGHEVTILTPDAMVGPELVRVSADHAKQVARVIGVGQHVQLLIPACAVQRIAHISQGRKILDRKADAVKQGDLACVCAPRFGA